MWPSVSQSWVQVRAAWTLCCRLPSAHPERFPGPLRPCISTAQSWVPRVGGILASPTAPQLQEPCPGCWALGNRVTSAAPPSPPQVQRGIFIEMSIYHLLCDVCWSRSGREDGVYQPVSTSCRAQPAEGRASSAGASRAAAPAASSSRTPRKCGERQPEPLAARDKGTSRRRAVRGVAGGNEPPAFLLQRPWSFSHPGIIVWRGSGVPSLWPRVFCV